jgi:hypothetical protein
MFETGRLYLLRLLVALHHTIYVKDIMNEICLVHHQMPQAVFDYYTDYFSIDGKSFDEIMENMNHYMTEAMGDSPATPDLIRTACMYVDQYPLIDATVAGVTGLPQAKKRDVHRSADMGPDSLRMTAHLLKANYWVKIPHNNICRDMSGKPLVDQNYSPIAVFDYGASSLARIAPLLFRDAKFTYDASIIPDLLKPNATPTGIAAASLAKARTPA